MQIREDKLGRIIMKVSILSTREIVKLSDESF